MRIFLNPGECQKNPVLKQYKILPDTKLEAFKTKIKTLKKQAIFNNKPAFYYVNTSSKTS